MDGDARVVCDVCRSVLDDDQRNGWPGFRQWREHPSQTVENTSEKASQMYGGIAQKNEMIGQHSYDRM